MQGSNSNRSELSPNRCCDIGPAAVADLAAINRIVEDAMQGWNISARVRRLSLPLYRYSEQDLAEFECALAKAPEIAGVAALELPARGDGPAIALLHGIYVTPQRQNSGIGGLLLRWAELDAQQRGIASLCVRARPEAVAFFEARGYLPATDSGSTAAYPWLLQKTLRI